MQRLQGSQWKTRRNLWLPDSSQHSALGIFPLSAVASTDFCIRRHDAPGARQASDLSLLEPYFNSTTSRGVQNFDCLGRQYARNNSSFRVAARDQQTLID